MVEAKINVKLFLENYSHIIDKERKDTLLKFNDAQEKIYETIARQKKKRQRCMILVLKARQIGGSTFTENCGMAMNVLYPNQSMFIMTHEEKASNQLYAMSHYAYENYPEWIKSNAMVDKDNQSLMTFTNGSKLQVMVASPNSKGTGRGQTYTFAHLSEYDWWNGDAPSILAGVLSACTKDAVVIVETTANGCGNFKKLWDNAIVEQQNGNEDGWIPLFFAWWQQKEYRKKYTGFELDREERMLQEKFGLDLDQLEWRRYTIKNVFLNDVNLFHQEFPSTPEEAFISSGQCIFDLNAINEQKLVLRERETPFEDKGYFLYDYGYDQSSDLKTTYNIRWVSDSRNGYITLFKKPIERHPYVFALDPAGEGSDFFAGQILDNMSCEQVCTIHIDKIDSQDIARQMYCLGLMYNEALLTTEINIGPEIISYLREFGYQKIYIRQGDETNIMNRVELKYGFRTTVATRPFLIDKLIQYVNKEAHLINDYQTLVEAENFVRVYKLIDGRTKSKEQANVGQHDDLLMALAIALYIRDSGQQSFELLPDENEVKEKPLTEFDKLFGKDSFEEADNGAYMTYE